jgi:hypothetical protein
MPLGLAKDSMINLAEMAHQKEDDHDKEGEIKLEDGTEETLVMRLETHEIATLQAALDAEEKEEADHVHEYLEEEKSSDPVMIGDTDSVNSDTASELAKRATAEAAAATPEQRAVNSNGDNGTSYGNYPGFSVDYSEYDHYGDYASYAGTPVLGQKKQSDQPFWCCLFPWLASTPPQGEQDENDFHNEDLVEIQRTSTRSSAAGSTGSDVFGERLSDKDRQAVLARLRLAQPDAKTPSSPIGDTSEDPGTATDQPSAKAPGKGLLTGIVANNVQKRGILKQTSTLTSRNNLKDAAMLSGGSSADGKRQRRSLFPSYETKSQEKKNLHCEFSPMARVLTVKSHKDMEDDEKKGTWWQRADYEEFRKTGRMITRAMLEGGSEIWLATNSSWQTPNKDKQSTLKKAYSLADRHAAFSKGDLNAKKEYEDTRDKWWHKFGHSRRGLEHIASIDEGRQRQANVRAALKAVMDEQRRQKIFHREDPDKLRSVCLQHTSWARDLSMAAGASDADAVQMGFNDGNRKSREFYLLKFSRSNQMQVHSTKKASVPAFMKPALSLVQPSRLDANTVPQIRYRQAQNKKRIAPAPPGDKNGKSANEKVELVPVPIKSEEDNGSSMAKQAAGFASGEEIGNMSSVLIGMGAIPA